MSVIPKNKKVSKSNRHNINMIDIVIINCDEDASPKGANYISRVYLT